MATEFDVCVIGTGPGGYVAAIRASQLGFKTAVVEKRFLGGVCLNIGCIPTKALLRSAEVYESISHAADYGIDVKSFSANFEGMIKRSRGVADKMSKGVQFLMKANKIEVLNGTGVFKSAKELAVKCFGCIPITGCQLAPANDTVFSEFFIHGSPPEN